MHSIEVQECIIYVCTYVYIIPFDTIIHIRQIRNKNREQGLITTIKSKETTL